MARAELETPGERALLTASLDGARQALAATLIGVPVPLLGEPLVPPGGSLLDVIKHVTLLERLWFAHTFGGLDVTLGVVDEHVPLGCQLERSDTARAVVAGYHAECERSRGVIERAGLTTLQPVRRRADMTSFCVGWCST